MTKTEIAVLVGVIPPLVVAAILGFSKTARRAISSVWHRTRPDHRALFLRPAWGISAVTSGRTGKVRFLAACAPSRSLRHPGVDPDPAIRFVRDHFPGLFPDQPAFSTTREGVKFTASPDGSPQDGYAWVWATGRVDLCIEIQPHTTDDGRVIVPVLDIFRPIALLADAMASHAYTAMFGRPRWPLRKRFDWFIGVSGDVLRADGCTVSWDDIEFPGRKPERAGAHQQSYCPPSGFASNQLRSWNPYRPVTDLLAVFLDDFLKTNGYHNVDGAITDTVRAFEAHQALPAAEEPARSREPTP